MGSIFQSMLDRFEVFRDAEGLVKEWGPVDYLFPHLKGDRFKTGVRIGVIVGSRKVPDAPVALRYGQMDYGFKNKPIQKRGSPSIDETSLMSGGEYQPLFKFRRCLIPVDRWFFKKQDARGRHFFCFHPVAKTTMAFAGLYSSFANPNGTRINTVGIIGLSSNEFYREYDLRMPAIFFPGPEAIQFLDPKLPETKAWELLRAWPIDNIMREPCLEWGLIGE